MKIRLLTAILLLTGIIASAQMGGMYGNRNRGMMQQPQSDEKPKAPSADEQLDKFMAEITTNLELNGLQEAAIRNIYKDQMKQMEAIKTSSMPDSDKQEEARLLSEKTDKEVKALLDAPQLEKYESLKKDLRAGKKPKKKKKKDEDEKEPHE